MTVLYRNRQLNFTALRDTLGLTTGNLGSHANRLEQAGYVRSFRALAGLSFEVRYAITAEGRDAFLKYLATLRNALEAMDPGTMGTAPHEYVPRSEAVRRAMKEEG